MSIIKNNKNYGTKVVVEQLSPTPYPEYLTGTYMVTTPTNGYKILNSTNNVRGWRYKGETEWRTPVANIAATEYGIMEIEFDLTNPATLDGYMFYNVKGLTKIGLAASIATINENCFFGSGLIDYPNMANVTTAGQHLFFQCPIKSMGLTINDNVARNYNDLAFNGFDFTDVIDKVYVNGTVYIALFHTQNGGDVDLTNGIDGLPFHKWFMYAGHMHYNLNSLKFPSTLQYLSGFAFKDCTIANLYFYGTTPPECIPFDGQNIWAGSNITNIYVPAEALAAYQNSTDFATVASKIQPMA